MKLYKINGQWFNLNQLSKNIYISRPTIYKRMKQGFSMQDVLDYYTSGYVIEEEKEIKFSRTEKNKINNALKLIEKHIDNWKDGFELTDLIEIRKVLKEDER